ncbi:MAG: hypothetical protein M3Q45_11905 [Chloroflexota bacterium]|nr:hypothetical protein [Chloroflexota bacterium]
MLEKSQALQLLNPTDAHLFTAQSIPDDDTSIEVLRKILFGEDRNQITLLQSDLERVRGLLDRLERQINDDEALARTISPIIAGAITSSIRDARETMVEALYPIIGPMVVRAVSEAMRDLARRIDQQMRSALNVQSFQRQLQARLRGVPPSEMALRQALPCQVQEVFLIHRENGLLLHYLSCNPDLGADSDLISGMLTAIRDFAADAFGGDAANQLNSIQYGDKVILAEVAQHAYVAVVIEGIEPQGFRAAIREQVIAIEHEYAAHLRQYNGDASLFAATMPRLSALMQSVAPTVNAHPEAPDAKTSPTFAPNFVPDFVFVLGVLMMAVLLTGLLFWQLQSS